jgi:hypothetical protein
MRSLIAIALLIMVTTARDDQTGDCIRKGKCQDVRVEQTLTLPAL